MNLVRCRYRSQSNSDRILDLEQAIERTVEAVEELVRALSRVHGQ